MGNRLSGLTAALVAAAIVFCGCARLRVEAETGGMLLFSALGEMRPQTEAGPLFGTAKPNPLAGLTPDLSARSLVMADLAGGFNFNCPPSDNALVWQQEWLPSLTEVNLRVLNLADDHALDCGPDALSQSLNWLLLREFYPAGAGFNQTSARAPVYLNRDGVTLGIAAFLVAPLNGEACETCPGPARYKRSAMIAALAEMKSRADHRIVVLHFAERASPALANEETALVREAIDYGADLILGVGPTAAGALARVRGRWIIGSLGRALGGPDRPDAECDGLMISAEFTPDKIMNLRLMPVKLKEGKPALLRDEAAAVALRKILAASPDAAANATLVGDILYLK